MESILEDALKQLLVRHKQGYENRGTKSHGESRSKLFLFLQAFYDIILGKLAWNAELNIPVGRDRLFRPWLPHHQVGPVSKIYVK